MLQKSLLLIIILALPFSSCRNLRNNQDEKPVARVLDIYLYPSDLVGLIPAGISGEDSSRIARRIIEEWVREKLMVNNAEVYLSDEQKDVTNQLEEYRSSLLTFKYKQKLLSQNLDTIVKEEELKSFYSMNSSNYILDKDYVRVNYVKIPIDAPQVSDVRRWYKSNLPEDLDNLEKYCITYANNYMINGEKWMPFINLIAPTPLVVENPKNYLNFNNNIELKDSLAQYFIHIIDRVQEGQVAPLELVKEDIRSVILNKRKMAFMEDLENTVYNDGVAKKKVEIY